LEELLKAHPELVDTFLTIIIQATARQIGDEDLSVRRATLSFLRCILNLAPSTSLQPHAHTLLLFTTSALSHIFPEIRVDASKVLQLLLEHFSTAVVEGWESDNVASQRSGSGLRILHALLALLHVSPKENKELGKCFVTYRQETIMSISSL
jgi:pre-rRNA-processing protein IPI1